MGLKIATKSTLPFHNKQIQRRDNRENFKTVEIISVDISARPRAVFSTI